MNITRVNGFNNVNSNQSFRKNSYKPNFGLFVLADAQAGETLIKAVRQIQNSNYAEDLVNLIQRSTKEKGIVYTNGKGLVEAYDDTGYQIFQTRNATGFASLSSALISLLKDSTRELKPVGTQEMKPLEKTTHTIGEIADRLREILTDCPKSIQGLLKKPSSKKPIELSSVST